MKNIVDHKSAIIDARPTRFITEEDISVLNKHKNESGLLVGMHLRFGDDATGAATGLSAFAKEQKQYLDCVKSSLENITRERCPQPCPFTSIKLIGSSDHQGQKVLESIASALSKTSTVGLEGNLLGVSEYINLLNLGKMKYHHVADLNEDVEFKSNLEGLASMLTLANCDVLIRKSSGFNYLSQIFGGVDTGRSAMMGHVNRQYSNYDFCDRKTAFRVNTALACSPLNKDWDDESKYQRC